jgi:hypothetical protein
MVAGVLTRKLCIVYLQPPLPPHPITP